MPQLEPQYHIERSSRSRLAINFAPLIDVVFLLLVFFMLTTSFLEPEAVTLRLSGETRPAPPGVENIVVEVSSDGGLKLMGSALPLEQLTAQIGLLIASDANRAVSIRAERDVPVQRTIQVMDHVRAAGSENIKFITRVAP